jgi:hypothetical protein
MMSEVKGDKLHVRLSASQVRRRLKGLGFGVRKVHSAGVGEALIIHTATGQHLRDLRALFEGRIVSPREEEESKEG